VSDDYRTSEWLVRYCANQECRVRIRERVGEPGAATCKWCQEKMREQHKEA
jgi:hypothetical protein